MSPEDALLGAFEVHSPSDIRQLLFAGVSAVRPIHGKPPIDHLIEMYMRSPRFAECLRILLDAGATISDPLVQAVLLDDSAALRSHAGQSPDSIHKRITVQTAFTSCREVTLLHLCAEFNSIECGRALIVLGADVNASSGLDSEGIGGHTPIFHTVNSIFNHSRPMLELLIHAGASLDICVPLILWGDQCPWETIVFDATPLSYAQCGLYRQFHREEPHIYSNLALLHRARYGVTPPQRNVPNQYLANG